MSNNGLSWCPACRKPAMYLESGAVLRCKECGYYIKGELLADVWLKHAAIENRIRNGALSEVIVYCPVCGVPRPVRCVPVLDTGLIAYSWGCCGNQFVLSSVQE